MNFRLLSNTLIAPAGRRLSGADIFAPPAEVCGTNFPLPLPCLWGSVSQACFWAFLFSSLNKRFSISCKMPIFHHPFAHRAYDFHGAFLCAKAQGLHQRTAPRLYRGGGVKFIKVSVEPYYQEERSPFCFNLPVTC